MKKTKETEQYSNAKNYTIPKSGPMRNCRKSVVQNIGK